MIMGILQEQYAVQIFTQLSATQLSADLSG